MSGGKMLAEMLADKLNYRCVSREVIITAASEYGVPENKLTEAIKKSPSIFQKLTFEREQYLAYIQAILCEYSKDDNIIYHGNAGHFLLPGISHVLRVRLLAEMPYRIKSAMEQLNLSEDDAVKYIKRVDQERVKWTKFLYGKDWRSPELYDIVFNLGQADFDFVCEMIIHAVRQPAFQATSLSSKAMADLLLASKLRAALASMENIRLDLLDIHADNGTVIIGGKVKSQKLMDEILDVANKLEGVDKIENKVRIDYRGYGIE